MKDLYENLTDNEFDTILAEIINEDPASDLLLIPGIYEVLKEHFNNEVLQRWENNQEINKL